ncbi:Uncharacterized protein dnl_52990 [Desulfonema limicola]|uniref:Uncharacterized protein n=1 Tax=Desulfonema limicola TaxID=45656 RepID=A0A975BCN1_9BACT|nr:Uncharacterized protein dnl_52990 [Desulfonema limicola]
MILIIIEISHNYNKNLWKHKEFFIINFIVFKNISKIATIYDYAIAKLRNYFFYKNANMIFFRFNYLELIKMKKYTD